MKRVILILALLLTLAGWAPAECLLIKIDKAYLPIVVNSLNNPDKIPKEFNFKGVQESGEFIYGIFEFKRVFSTDGKVPKEGNEYTFFDPAAQSDILKRLLQLKDPNRNDMGQAKDLLYSLQGLNPLEKQVPYLEFDPATPLRYLMELKQLKEPDGKEGEKTKVILNKLRGPLIDKRIELDQKSGKRIFPIVPGLIVKDVNIRELKMKSPLEAYQKKKEEAADAAKLQSLAFWTLEHGLTKEFHETMAALEKMAPQHPAVERYARIKKDMNISPTAETLISKDTRTELENLGSKLTRDHYVAYWKKDASISEKQIARRLDRLEDICSNFFFWCALQEGMTLPNVPKYRLPVLVEPRAAFDKRLKDEGRTKATSGIVIRRDGLLVQSASPKDELFQDLTEKLNGVFTNRPLDNRADLASGAVWNNEKSWSVEKTKTGANKKINPKMDLAILHMLVLLQKSMEDDLELSTLSREGTRQLLSASGFLARNVRAPEWLEAGLVSYFEIPPKHLYLGFGLARADLLREFKEFTADDKIKSADVLNDMATDRYLRPINREAAAWALIYYLADHKMKHVSDYAQKLNELPRHMRFGAETLKTCFKHGFNVDDLGEKWFEEINRRVYAETTQVDEFFALPR
jgi:Protein of unknown function (DUF1570)